MWIRSPHIRTRASLYSLLLLALFLAGCGTTPAPVSSATPSMVPAGPPALRSTLQLAADYFSAVLNSNQAALDSMIGADAWCTTPDSSATVEKQARDYSSAEVRNQKNEAMDISGWVAYPPGAEAARVSFEYRIPGRQDWITASLVVVTIQSQDKESRYICSVTN